MSESESIPVGISLPRDLIRKLDESRGDVPRSRYVLRLVQRAYASMEEQKE